MRIGTNELLIILVVVLLIFGPKNLPKLGKMFGKTINGFKKGMEDEDAEQSEETVKKADKKDEDEENLWLQTKSAKRKHCGTGSSSARWCLWWAWWFRWRMQTV